MKLEHPFATPTSDAISLTEKEHEPKVELPYWCGKIYPTAYCHHFKQKYWNVLAFRSALPPVQSTLFRLIAPEAVVLPTTSEISEKTFSSFPPHAQSFFICGDSNARHSSWGCARANSAGNALFECDCDFAIYYPPSPTRTPLNRMQSP
jgi:hypothetical protein